MEDVKIEEIQIVPLRPINGLVGFVSFSINNAFRVGNCAIYTSPNRPLGYRILFPTKKLASGKQVPCFYPFRKEIEEAITNAIVSKYVELMESFPRID